MKAKTNHCWRLWLAALGAGLCLGLAGCMGGMAGDSYEYDEPEPPGPTAHDYYKQSVALADQGRWLEAAEWLVKASDRAALSPKSRRDGTYLRSSAYYLEKAGHEAEAKVRWREAAQLYLQAVQNLDRKSDNTSSQLSNRSFLLKSAAECFAKAGDPEQARVRWKEAAVAAGEWARVLQQEFAKEPPARQGLAFGSIATAFSMQAENLYKAGEGEAAVSVLQDSALPWAEQEWNAPRKPDDQFPPSKLLRAEGLLGEVLLASDKKQADAVFTRLWSRRDHPYTVDGGGWDLWRAAEALREAGDGEFARRMYMAATQTRIIDLAATRDAGDGAFPFATRLRELGFEQEALEAEQRMNDAKTLHANETIRQAEAIAKSKYSYDTEMELALLYAAGYEYFGNQALADSFRREAAVYEYKLRQEEKYERDRQARVAARQAKEEEGSLFMTFVNALSGGLQAYAGSRRQGASALASNTAALEAAARASASGSGAGNPALAASLGAPRGAAGGVPLAQTPASAGSGGASMQRKQVREATHCVTRDQQTGTGADYLGNSCDFPILVSWFSPDDAICRSGCSGSLKAHQARSSVSKLKGRIIHAACEYPHGPKNPDGGRWTATGQHICAAP